MIKDCWNKIGVVGDRSCSELKTFIHCRNCPVYSAAGRGLLEQEAPPEYINEWTEVLAKKQPDQILKHENESHLVRSADTISAMIFRLADEWLALPVRLFQEVTQPCVIHTLPHRSDDLFLGLVNIRGEILMCISLYHLLALDKINPPLLTTAINLKRMVVIANNENRWVFTVDEVCGVHRFNIVELQNAPIVISKAPEAYTKGVIRWEGKKVNYLDPDLLFYTLNRRIL